MYLLVLLFLSTGSNIGCIDSSCTGCISGYLYKGLSCLDQCPTGYISTNSPNTCTASSTQQLFSIKFNNFLKFGATSIGDFSHPTGLQFQDSAKLSPIPSQTSGFYFVSTSKLKSTQNWVLAPDFTLKISIRIISDGVIFEIIDGVTYFQLVASAGIVVAHWYLTSPSTSAAYSVNSFAYSNWKNFVLFSEQTDGLFSMSVNGYTNSVSGFEFRPQTSNLLYYIGASTGTSFTGYFQELIGLNTVDNDYHAMGIDSYCNYQSYYWYGCSSCGACSNSWPWCITSSCSTCYSSSCSSCTGFGYSDCTACNNGRTPPDCDIGVNCQTGGSSTFNCNTCSSGYINIDGLCLKTPYNYNSGSLTTPVLNIVFDTFHQYYGGLFQSGSNAATYAPFNSPEYDDLIPVKKRGIYFNGVGMYLKSQSNLVMNYKSTLAYWIFPKNNNYPWCSSACFFYGGGFGYVYLTSKQQRIKYVTNIYWNLGMWVFHAYSIDFYGGITTIRQTSGSKTVVVAIVDGQANYDNGGIAWIGTICSSASGPYYGFMYKLVLWQTVITDFSSAYDVCGSGENASCLWTCNLLQYYNYYEGSCINCDSSCISGCSTWGTCNKCLDADCSTCTGYDDSCSLTLPNACLTGLSLSPNKNCCNTACMDCFNTKNYNCLNCNGGTYLLGTVCVSVCPLGYNTLSASCVENLRPGIILTLDKISDTVIDSQSGIEFSTGTGTEFYPNPTNSDPIPSMQRGYYFKGTSYMTSEIFSLSYNFTMAFYIKHMAPGILFTKGTLVYSTATLTLTDSIFVSVFTLTPTTDWTVLTLQLSTRINGDMDSILSINSLFSTSQVIITDKVYIDSNSALVLGDPVDSYIGFLYKFILYNSLEDTSGLTVTMCSNLISDSCLWNCDSNSYLSVNTCYDCDLTCTDGCRNGLDCNLCEDTNCYLCSDFSTGCENCFFHYYDEGPKCELCQRCEICNGNDCECLENSNSNCICDDGYYMNNNQCELCESLCKTCLGGNYYQCASCFDYMLEVVCITPCPLGFEQKDNMCTWEKEEQTVVEYVFNTLQGMFYDKVNQVSAITGTNTDYYPNLDETDPVPAYERGVYFAGNGAFLAFPYPPDRIRLLGLRFSISIWLNPSSHSGTLLYKSQQTPNLLFSITLQNLYLKTTLYTHNNYYTITSIYILYQNQWNHIQLSVDYKTETFIKSTTNTLSDLYSFTDTGPFVDTVGTAMYIGASALNSDYLQGFIYSLAIYSSIPLISSLATKDCNRCSICFPSEICIPNCDISAYYEKDVTDCVACSGNCTNGCRNSENCELCIDPYCVACKDFNSSSCVQCESGYEVIDSKCIGCQTDQYYDAVSKTCENCPNLCNQCESDTYCLKCTENSHLASNNSCICDQGYSGNLCTRNSFIAWVTLNTMNQATIVFSEPLMKTLTQKDLKVSVNQVSKSYELLTIDNLSAQLSIHFANDINSDDILVITFTSALISTENSILITNQLTIQLYAEVFNDVVSRISMFKYFAQMCFQVAVYSVLGSSAFMVDPTSFFNFLNSLEIIFYVLMYNIDLDLALVAFLEELQITSKIPNIFSYFINPDDGVKIHGRFSNGGCVSNLLLINSGISLTVLAVLIVLAIFSYLVKLMKIPWISEKFRIFNLKLKYRAFLRLWVQAFLEISFNVALALLNTGFQNCIQILDFCITLFFLVTYMQVAQLFLLVALVTFIVKRSKLMDIQDLDLFLSKFGTFFEEFKDDQISSYIFYIIFVFRRLTIAFLVLFIEEPIVQLSLSLIFSLGTCFYLIATKAMINTLSSRSIIVNELFTSLYFAILVVPCLSETLQSKEKTGTICIFILIASMMTTVLFSVAGTVKQVLCLLKKINQRKIRPEPILEIKEINNIFTKAYPRFSFRLFINPL